MRHRAEWINKLEEADGWAFLRRAMTSKPVDWAEISDVLWWAGVYDLKREDEGEESEHLRDRYLDYLRYHLRSHEDKGGGWYAGQRKTWVLGEAEFVMRWIPAGSFLMGLKTEDVPHSPSRQTRLEIPQREVTITRGFWMGETPVTQAQYQAIAGYNPSEYELNGLNAPVEMVTWHEAAQFTNSLSIFEDVQECFIRDNSSAWLGRFIASIPNDGFLDCAGWRLPTEAEWEYAARAGDFAAFLDKPQLYSVYSANSLNRTHPVKSKMSNLWGLYDMLGNVEEWCCDAFDENYHTTQSSVDPLVTPSNVYEFPRYATRGGSFDASGVRFSRRMARSPYPFDTVGFRLVRGGGDSSSLLGRPANLQSLADLHEDTLF